MIAIAQHLHLPALGELRLSCRQTFALRDTTWPPTLLPPPALWNEPWRGFVRDYGMPYHSLDAAYRALGLFWVPVFGAEPNNKAHWDGDTWTWQ